MPAIASEKPFLVVSDLHLGAVPERVEREFRRFLAFAATSASGLLINGDLFDVWLATRHFVVRHHIRVLAAIAEVVESGVPVYFVGGNHDAMEFGGEMLRDDLGVTLLDEPARIQLGTWNALVIHGDGMQPGRFDYPRYQKRHPFLRSRGFRWAAQRIAHVDRIYDRVAAWSATREFVDGHLRGDGTGPKPAAAPIEAWARSALRAEPRVDVVLAGHSHLPALVEVEQARYYFNTGDWISHMSFGSLPADRRAPELCVWPESQRDVAHPRTIPST